MAIEKQNCNQMKNLKYSVPAILIFFLFYCCAGNKENHGDIKEDKSANFRLGWASSDITPKKPVLLQGQFAARISESVRDPLTTTALAIESVAGSSSEKSILISCDLLYISDGLRDHVRKLLKDSLPELLPEQIILNATHTHTAADCSSDIDSKSIYGIELDAMAPAECQIYISEIVAKTAVQAWKNRKPGGISYGLGQAVVGHNRFWSDFAGKTTRRGNLNNKEFSHIEGFEDHSVNLLYTWDKKNNLTGVLINLACPAQALGQEYQISADFWHDTRLELNKRLGKDVFIFPQLSAAGDQSPHIMVGFKAEERMQRLMFGDSLITGNDCMGRRKQIAVRIADAVSSVLPYMKDNIEWTPVFRQRMAVVGLSRRLIEEKDLNDAFLEGNEYRKKFEQQLKEINENPLMKEKSRWYSNISGTYTIVMRANSVKERYELEKSQPKLPTEVHVVRIGDIVIATNPFELYLDYGMRIKVRSPAVQTFLVQLCGNGTYVPSSRSVAGGAYGAVPASNLIGPIGGQELVEKTLDMINKIME
jgi:hypothetical protein